jgi:hypothetical protein
MTLLLTGCCAFAPLVVCPSLFGSRDIVVLPVFLAASEQEHQMVPIGGEVDPIPGPVVDSGLVNAATDGLYVWT